MGVPKVDDIDLQILEVLQADGRISNLRLADLVGLSPTPCQRRVKRLEDAGVIDGYAARVNPAALGRGMRAIVAVSLSHQTPEAIADFTAAVTSRPEVTECLLLTGDDDYHLRVAVQDTDALRDFILEHLKPIASVERTSTTLILDELI